MLPSLRGSATPLCKEFDVALFDLDGVLYRLDQPVEHAAESVRSARAAGMRAEFVTNNASRTAPQVAELLRSVGVPANIDEVVTAAQAAAALLAQELPPGSAVLTVGSPALDIELAAVGLQAVRSADHNPVAVLQGFGPDVDWRLLAEGSLALHRGARWIATNEDPTLASTRGPLPGNGALVAALATASGRRPDVVVGKPHPRLHAESVRRSKAQRPLVIGDRLDTDIEGANRAGCDSLLVLTGVTTVREVLSAPPPHRPSFLALDLRGLLESHEAPQWRNEAASCGGWLANKDLELRGEGTPTDALRALCLASWNRDTADQSAPTATEPAAAKALQVLGL